MNSNQNQQGLPGYFLGKLIQVAVITEDFERSISRMVKLGIGPWAVYNVGPSNMTEFSYRGTPTEACSFRMGLARVGDLTWEVIQPISGQSIYSDFLARHGDGVQHLAFDCDHVDYDRQVQMLLDRGYDIIQSGVWMHKVRFHYFGTEGDIGTVVEIIDFPKDFDFPAPEAIIAA
ncbi:VOC family protein [Novosphingobium sp. KN65.2]|uniref:VOC family protein n=1 Tax=Novosphingobium sp. KN65.2 TaxID=1478134 RepID=UPI0005E9B6AC|nr:VOC family protein [Novosphingobium sp. KN65.2]CDO36599.1 conserved hypothetical protein [Novosphingobium sp. KN65.2]